MREKEPWKNRLAPLDKRIKAFNDGYRQNVAILGDDADEISYLLDNYLKLNRPRENVYINASASFVEKKEFFQAVVFSLLSEYTNRADTIDNLINCTAEVLPVTTKFIRAIFKSNSLTFANLLEIINKFINESGRRCILIIEEFLKLSASFPDPFKDFSKFIILQRNCMVILTSSFPRETEKVLAKEFNLLFGNFESLDLRAVTFLDSYLYLKNSLSPLSPSPLFLSFFVNNLGTNIIYYDLISEAIQKHYLARDEENSLVCVIEKILYDRETYLYQKFIKNIDFIKAGFREYFSAIQILIYLSKGYMRKKELLSLNICEAKNLQGKLTKLSELNYLDNLGGAYKIKDPLFSFWLSSVFTFYASPPILDPARRKVLWRKNIYEEVAAFKEDFLKDKLKKIVELLSSFQDDLLKTRINTYRLPRVKAVKIISYPAQNFYIAVGEGKEIIFAGIKEGTTEEKDILGFIEKGLVLRGRGVKKIFISLEKPSSAVRLIAKNHRLTIWDIDEVNHLLRIYNKSILS